MNVSVLLCGLLVSGFAAATSCPQHYLNGQEPNFRVPMHIDREICYSAYALGYHDATKSAFYSAEHLQAGAVRAAKALEREDNFHPDEHIPSGRRAELASFRGSGFDKGHLSPNKDFGTRQTQYESFSLANMVPQLHANNAGIWGAIESSVRYITLKEGETYVVTGGLYDQTTQKIKDNIPVPNALFKAVYLPKEQQAAVYVSNNDLSGTYEVISVAALTQRTGFDVFPALSASIKAQVAALPTPQKQKHSTPLPRPARSYSSLLLHRLFH